MSQSRCEFYGCSNLVSIHFGYTNRICYRHKPWLRKKVYNYTTRPNDNQFVGYAHLLCDEVFIRKPPTLQSIAAAKIVHNDIDKELTDFGKHVWGKMGEVDIEVFVERPCRDSTRKHSCRQYMEATGAPGCNIRFATMAANIVRFDQSITDIYGAYAHSPRDIIFKKDLKIIPRDTIKKRACKRKLTYFCESD